VNPKDKSRGIEKVLINAAINEIGKGGVGRIRVMVPTTKQELVETLSNLGFRETLIMDGMFKESRR